MRVSSRKCSKGAHGSGERSQSGAGEPAAEPSSAYHRTHAGVVGRALSGRNEEVWCSVAEGFSASDRTSVQQFCCFFLFVFHL